jgi:short-subunit dehydrogenase
MKRYTLITGASRGIGLALAHKFASQGDSLILAARTEQDLATNAHDLNTQYGVEVRTVACDLAQQSGVDALIAATAGQPIHTLINNAGYGLGGAFDSQDSATLTRMLFLNMTALTQLTHHFTPSLKEHKGILINVSSQAAFQPVPHMAAYAASKAYVLHLTEALHRELGAHGVQVLALCPAATDTQFFSEAGIAVEKTQFKLGRVEDVVDAAIHALAKRQAFVIPGFVNRAITFSGRFAPRSMVVKMAESMVRMRDANKRH